MKKLVSLFVLMSLVTSASMAASETSGTKTKVVYKKVSTSSSSCNACKKKRTVKSNCNTCAQSEPVYIVEEEVEEEPEVVYVEEPAPRVVKQQKRVVKKSASTKHQPDMYVGAHVGLSLLNFKNKYNLTHTSPETNTLVVDEGDDKYSFEPVWHTDVLVGRYFSDTWRGDVELGYVGKLSDSGDGLTFKLDTMYALANAYYDIDNGFYIGAGLGASVITSRFDGGATMYGVNGGTKKTKTSFMGALNVGYAYALADNLKLDIRYRLAAMEGLKQRLLYSGSEELSGGGYGSFTDGVADVKVGTILDHSISVGVRYEF